MDGIHKWLDCRAIYLFVSLSVNSAIYRSALLSVFPSIYPSVYLSIFNLPVYVVMPGLVLVGVVSVVTSRTTAECGVAWCDVA